MITHNFMGQFAGDGLAAGAAWVGDTIRQLGRPMLDRTVAGGVTLADIATALFFVLLTLLINALLMALLRRGARRAAQKEGGPGWRHLVVEAVGKPLQLVTWIYGIYLATTPFLRHLAIREGGHPLLVVRDRFLSVGLFIGLVWLCYRLTPLFERRLAQWASRSDSRFDDQIIPFIGKTLRVIMPVLAVILAVPLLGLPAAYSGVVTKVSSIMIIGAVTFVLIQSVAAAEKVVLAEYDVSATNNFKARKVYTQVHVLSKTLHVIIGIFAAASILMLFEDVRRFGTSILASAGVVGIIIGFAAQRTISNLFAGFQLAMTQPIRINDAVVLEGEFGTIEEITLTYVVVHLWDERRLIVPLSYFIEKPFQNWTRSSSAILGAVILYFDYTLPLDEIRAEAKRVIESSPNWNKKFWNLQVTDATERSMQVRVLVTAADAGKAFDLRCEVREKLLAFVRTHHLDSLPKTRTDVETLRFDPKIAPFSAVSDGLQEQGAK